MVPDPGAWVVTPAGTADPAGQTGYDGDDAKHVRAEAVIDLDAVEHNVRTLLAIARSDDDTVEVMAVVKADGYGHGALRVARAARRAGAVALGLATPAEAAALVGSGPDGGVEASADRPVVAWLWVPDEDVRPALAAGVQLVVSSTEQLSAVLAAGGSAPGGRPDIHLKIDSGLGRGGAVPGDFPHLVAAAAGAQEAGRVRVVGVMSHLACADVPGDPSVLQQLQVFTGGEAVMREAGLTVRWRHLANTPGTLEWPATRLNLVRCGIGVYGISPFEGPHPAAAQLRPVMTLRARVALTKRVPVGSGVSYGLTYRTTRETTLALVPVGYADGIPRSAGPAAAVWLAGRRRSIAGRIAMDQFVVDCGDDPVAVGDEVVIFGGGAGNRPTALDWAAAAGTIGYEIVTRIGPRVPRRYVGPGSESPVRPNPAEV